MRRALLIGLIAASIIMVTAYSREGSTGPLHTLQSAVSGAVSPLRIVGGSVEAATSTVGDTMENITADQNTLTGLREYNSQLEQQYAQMEEYKQETQRLQKLLEFEGQLPDRGHRARASSAEAPRRGARRSSSTRVRTRASRLVKRLPGPPAWWARWCRPAEAPQRCACSPTRNPGAAAMVAVQPRRGHPARQPDRPSVS